MRALSFLICCLEPLLALARPAAASSCARFSSALSRGTSVSSWLFRSALLSSSWAMRAVCSSRVPSNSSLAASVTPSAPSYTAPAPPASFQPMASPSYSDTSDSSSGCSLSSPISPPQASPSAPFSVQHYRSQFIKEGLKMKVQQKLKTDYGEQMDTLLVPKIKVEEEDSLTMEDELRRRRRRERNKVAATKCRNKKKERTGMLVKEGEILETQNSSLKMEISRLEAEKRHLMDILALHESSCTKRPRKEPGPAQQEPPADTGGQGLGLFRVPAPPLQHAKRQQQQQLQQLQATTSSSSSWPMAGENSLNIAEVVDSLTGITDSQVEIAESIDSIADTFGTFSEMNVHSQQDVNYLQHSLVGAESAEKTDKSLYKTCSFSRNAQTNNYFLGKPSSLPHHRLMGQLDNRCLAL